MTKRKFTPPTEFPAEYVDGNGNKAVILGRGPHKVFPFIGYNAAGYARYWTEKGTFSSLGINGFDLHDIPKRITTWHNVYQDATLGYNSFTSRDQTFPHSVGLKGLCVYRIERDVDGGNPEIFVEETE
jgi:hypothetical protein